MSTAIAPTPFDVWWDEHYKDVPTERADRTVSEEAFNAGLRTAWLHVFNVVSDMEYVNDNELIALLETARYADGQGPYIG